MGSISAMKSDNVAMGYKSQSVMRQNEICLEVSPKKNLSDADQDSIDFKHDYMADEEE